MRNSVQSTGLILTLLWFQIGTGRACECRSTLNPAQAFKKADAIFIGKVIRIQTNYRAKGGTGVTYITLSVSRSWKGNIGKTLKIATALQGCGYVFIRGRQYLIYANGHSMSALWTNRCSLTRDTARAGRLISILERRK